MEPSTLPLNQAGNTARSGRHSWFVPCVMTTFSTRYFASSVAVPVAPATPGIGKVRTALPAASKERVVLPAFRHTLGDDGTRVGAQSPFVHGPRQRGLRHALRIGPDANEPLLHRCGHRCGLALLAADLGASRVFVPRIVPAHHFDVRNHLPVRARAAVVNALTEGLVVRALAESCERAWLAVHLNGAASGLILERRDHVALVSTFQHSLVPVEHPGPQVLRAWCRCIRTAPSATLSTACWSRARCGTRWSLRATGASLRMGCGRRADHENKGDRGACPTIAATKFHGSPPSCRSWFRSFGGLHAPPGKGRQEIRLGFLRCN